LGFLLPGQLIPPHLVARASYKRRGFLSPPHPGFAILGRMSGSTPSISNPLLIPSFSEPEPTAASGGFCPSGPSFGPGRFSGEGLKPRRCVANRSSSLCFQPFSFDPEPSPPGLLSTFQGKGFPPGPFFRRTFLSSLSYSYPDLDFAPQFFLPRFPRISNGGGLCRPCVFNRVRVYLSPHLVGPPHRPATHEFPPSLQSPTDGHRFPLFSSDLPIFHIEPISGLSYAPTSVQSSFSYYLLREEE